jgi:hypothetical protein
MLPVAAPTNILPSQMYIDPKESTVANVPAFLITSEKASLAAAQKFMSKN